MTSELNKQTIARFNSEDKQSAQSRIASNFAKVNRVFIPIGESNAGTEYVVVERLHKTRVPKQVTQESGKNGRAFVAYRATVTTDKKTGKISVSYKTGGFFLVYITLNEAKEKEAHVYRKSGKSVYQNSRFGDMSKIEATYSYVLQALKMAQTGGIYNRDKMLQKNPPVLNAETTDTVHSLPVPDNIDI